MDVVSLLNSMYALLERHHRVLRALDQLEAERLRNASDMQRQQVSQGRLKVSFYRCCWASCSCFCSCFSSCQPLFRLAQLKGYY